MLSKTLSKLISRGPPFNDQGGGLADRRPVAWVAGFQPPAWRTASRSWLRRSSHRATSDALMRFSTSRALIFEGGSARLKFRFHLLKGGLRSLQRTFSPLTVLRIRRFLFAALRLPLARRFLIGQRRDRSALQILHQTARFVLTGCLSTTPGLASVAATVFASATSLAKP